MLPVVLATFAVLAGALAWMFASAGLTRYRSPTGSGWTELLPALVAGLVAALLAVLAIVAVRVKRRQATVTAAIAQTPGRPWQHVPRWSQGRIQDAPAKQAAAALGVFAAVWMAVVIGAALLARGRDDLRSDTTVLVFLGLFGLVGLGHLPESDLPEMPAAGTMRVSWLLSIAASLPGVDYAAVFGVPVFPTEQSDRSFVTEGSRADKASPVTSR